MSGNSAKRLINWHTGWLGEKDANGDLVGAWAQYSENEQFKCCFCDVERKYSNGGRSSFIQHPESGKQRLQWPIFSAEFLPKFCVILRISSKNSA